MVHVGSSTSRFCVTSSDDNSMEISRVEDQVRMFHLVCFLMSSKQFFSHVGTGLPGFEPVLSSG